MNITFLIGNGFDMASGIDTSYSSFYEWYCKQPSEKECIKKFKQDIKDDLKKGGKNWADFEIGLGRYTENFSAETVNDFFECYDDAQAKIIQFLKVQQSQFVLEDFDDAKLSQFKEGLMNFYQNLFPQERDLFKSIMEAEKANNIRINFLSFNYTDTLNKLVDIIAKTPLMTWQHNGNKKLEVNKTVISMHGTYTHYPLLGVDNVAQIANQELLQVPDFKEIMIKPLSVIAAGERWHSEAEEIIRKSRIIGIFGMSLGDSDKRWWNTIVNWLKENKSRHLIIYWYTSTPPDNISLRKTLGETAKAKAALYKHVELSYDEKEAMDSQIHVAINTTDVLNFRLEKKKQYGVLELAEKTMQEMPIIDENLIQAYESAQKKLDEQQKLFENLGVLETIR